MKKFMDKDFILKSDFAKKLYHDYAAAMPICDYHCHLDPSEVWEDKQFENITQMWLGGDHYKWRAMRLNGVAEEFITGDADDYAKFVEYAKTMERAVGNPLYHWTHLELQRYFDVHTPLSERTAKEIWDKCNAVIKSEGFSVRKILEDMNVAYAATTDDPADSLEYHIKIKEEGKVKTVVAPTFRPDQAIAIEKAAFKAYISRLADVAEMAINSLEELESALVKRIEFFNNQGCSISDHGLTEVPGGEINKDKATKAFEKALQGEALTKEEEDNYKTYVLVFLAKQYTKYNWVMQLHIGPMRSNSKKMFDQLGADTGFDSIIDGSIAMNLSSLLNTMEMQEGLPKTVLYTLNPTHNYVLGTMLGNFSANSTKGKMQFGSGWWFCDQKQGMIDQMTTLANLGLLGNFIGMLTDSRSFLSYPRHEYFRRILCNMIGEWVEDGELPDDLEHLGKLVQDISYNNVAEYIKK